MMSFFKAIPTRTLSALVLIYRYGPGRLLPQVCRFRPSCSEYMLTALKLHGACRGGWLGTKRICRCHPWHEGGIDPVPGDEEHFCEEEGKRLARTET